MDSFKDSLDEPGSFSNSFANPTSKVLTPQLIPKPTTNGEPTVPTKRLPIATATGAPPKAARFPAPIV